MDYAPTTAVMDSAPTIVVMESAPTTALSAPTIAVTDSAPATTTCSAPLAMLSQSTDTELVSSTGKYIATFAPKQGMWRISDAKKKSIGSRKKRGAAVADLHALELGQHKSQKLTKAEMNTLGWVGCVLETG